MTKTKTTKRALIASVLSLLVCVSMLIGSTFAWFTDTATTGVNKIQTGTLDVGLIDEDGNSLENETLSFADKDGKTDILWEPGCTFLTQGFKVVNNGNLQFKYKIEITGLDGNSELLEVIKFSIVKKDEVEAALQGRSYTDLCGTWQITYDENGKFVSTLVGPIASETMYVMAHMDETAGNIYQGKSLEGIGITVYATQDTVENDSFSDQYDKDAEYGTVAVSTANEMIEAINKGKPVILKNDIEMNVAQYDVYLGTAETKAISIDGNGNTILFKNDLEQARIYTVNPDAVLTIKNATIGRTNPTVGNYLTFLSFYCNTNLTNVKAAESINLWGVAKTYNLTDVEIVDTRTAAEHYAMFIKSGNTVTIDGCVFDNDETGNRGIKVSDVNSTEAEAQTVTNLTVKNTTFASKEKGAILVGTKYGANVTLENVDITKVADDSTNAVWVEDQYASYTDTIVVTGGTKVIEQ